VIKCRSCAVTQVLYTCNSCRPFTAHVQRHRDDTWQSPHDLPCHVINMTLVKAVSNSLLF